MTTIRKIAAQMAVDGVPIRERTVKVELVLSLDAYEKLAALAVVRKCSQVACVEAWLRAAVLDGGRVRVPGEGLR